jgi:hypothetical protein
MGTWTAPILLDKIKQLILHNELGSLPGSFLLNSFLFAHDYSI